MIRAARWSWGADLIDQGHSPKLEQDLLQRMLGCEKLKCAYMRNCAHDCSHDGRGEGMMMDLLGGLCREVRQIAEQHTGDDGCAAGRLIDMCRVSQGHSGVELENGLRRVKAISRLWVTTRIGRERGGGRFHSG